MAKKKVSDYKKIFHEMVIPLRLDRKSGYELQFCIARERSGHIRKTYEAGCRTFFSKEEALEHWEMRERHNSPDTDASLRSVMQDQKIHKKRICSLVLEDTGVKVNAKQFRDMEKKVFPILLMGNAKRHLQQAMEEIGIVPAPNLTSLLLIHEEMYQYRILSREIRNRKEICERAKKFQEAIHEFPEEVIVRRFKKIL